MPEIPTFTAGNLERPLRTTAHIPESPIYGAGERLSQTIQKVAQNTQDQFQKIAQMRDENELVDMAGKWDAGIKDIHLDLEFDPEIIAKPERYMLEFNKRAQKLREDLVGQSTTKNVNVGFQNYVDRKYPGEFIDAKAKGLKYGVISEVAKLDEQKFKLAEESARAKSPAERNQKMAMYHNLVNIAEKNGLINKVEAVKRHQDFMVHAETNYMTVVGRTNPDLMMELQQMGAFDNVPELAQTAIVDRSIRIKNEKENRLRLQEDRAKKEYAENLERTAESLISTRKLTPEWIEQNRDYVTSEKYHSWHKALRDQEGQIGTGNPRIESAMQADVFNPNLDPRKTYERLDQLYVAGLIGAEKHAPWAT